MINAELLVGLPIRFNKYITIFPPTVKQMLAENRLGLLYMNILTNSQEELEDYWAKENFDGNAPTPWQDFIMKLDNEETRPIMLSALYFFTKTEFTYIRKLGKLLIGNLEEEVKRNTDIKDFKFFEEDDFFDFQNKIRMVCGVDQVKRPDPDEDPRVKRIKAKARYRDKIKAKQGKGTSFDTTLTAICCMGIGLTPLNVGEVSYASINSLITMYQQKESFEFNQKLALAGAKNVSKKYWIQ